MALVIDQGLGLDIALAHRRHIGGPGGFVVSLMTAVIVIGFALWLIEKRQNRRPVIFEQAITIPAVLFILFNFISGFQSIQLYFTITLSVLYLQCFLMYVFIVNHVVTWDDVRLVITVLMITLLFQSTIMVFQYATGFQFAGLGVETTTAGGGSRVAGTLESPNAAATYIMVTTLLAFVAYLSGDKFTNKYLAAAALGMGGLALIFTFSRSAWVGFLVGAAIISGTAWYRGVARQKVTTLFIIGFLVVNAFSQEISTRLATFGTDQSSQERLHHIKLALNILDKNLFTGIGANNLLFVEKDYLPLELMGKVKSFFRIHNKYWLVAVETGLFGVISFLWLLLAALWYAFRGMVRAVDPYVTLLMAGLLAVLLGYMLHMNSDTFDSRLRIEPLWFYLGLIVATARLCQSNTTEPSET